MSFMPFCTVGELSACVLISVCASNAPMMQQAERAGESQIKKPSFAACGFFVEDGDALDFTSES